MKIKTNFYIIYILYDVPGCKLPTTCVANFCSTKFMIKVLFVQSSLYLKNIFNSEITTKTLQGEFGILNGWRHLNY